MLLLWQPRRRASVPVALPPRRGSTRTVCLRAAASATGGRGVLATPASQQQAHVVSIGDAAECGATVGRERLWTFTRLDGSDRGIPLQDLCSGRLTFCIDGRSAPSLRDKPAATAEGAGAPRGANPQVA